MKRAPFVLLLGGANLDVTARADAGLRPGDSSPGSVRLSPGGVARNVAENLARLGHRCRLLSVVGDDAQGRALRAATRLAGVDVSGCLVLPGVATALYVSVHDGHGEMAVAVNQMQALEQLTAQRLQPQRRALDDAAAVVVDGNLSAEALGWVFEQRADRDGDPHGLAGVRHDVLNDTVNDVRRDARYDAQRDVRQDDPVQRPPQGRTRGRAHRPSRGTAPVFADAVSAAKCTRLRPWLHRVHTLKANRLEAQVLSGMATDTPAGVQAAARRLHALGVARVLISLGDAGIFFSDAAPTACRSDSASTQGFQPAGPARVCSTTGAGDALMAGLVHGHLAGMPLAQAARFAGACAALTLTVPGATHPGLSLAAVAHMLDTGG